MQKTNAMRALDARKIPYDTFSFSDDIRSADGVAATLGIPEAEVFKTLVVLPETHGKRPMLVMLPASTELDLRKFARAIGEKSVRMAPQRSTASMSAAASAASICACA
jgi:Cys-tRNA(Pro)/Cys-tRNA(Cys) deacylase